MNKIGIIGAMEVEVAQLKEKMQDVQVKKKANMEFCEGTLNGAKVVIVKCGIGKVNAGMCVQILTDLFNTKMYVVEDKNEVSLVKVTKNGEELSSDKFEKTRDEDKGKDLIEINEDVITAGETLNYEVETVVDLNEGNTEAVELINEDSLEVDETEVATAKVNHILQPESEESENENENEGNNGNNGENNFRYSMDR